MCIGLRNGLCENLCKVLASEWVAAVVCDEIVEAVKHLLLNQKVLGLPVDLLRTYATVIHWRMIRTLSPAK